MDFPLTFKDCEINFECILSDLEFAVQQTIVHKKKFEFAINQFRRFISEFKKLPNLHRQIAQIQVDAFKQAKYQLIELQNIFINYQSPNWLQSTVENQCSMIAGELCTISRELFLATSLLDQQAASHFISDGIRWIPFQILDLKHIDQLLKQYIQEAANEQEDEPLIAIMRNRLQSIADFLHKYSDANIQMISPDIRIFSPIPLNYQSWRIQYSDLNAVEKVATGSSSEVFRGYYKKTGKQVAIKKLTCEQLSGLNRQTFQREISILASISHPACLQFIGATDYSPYCIVTEWMPNGTLFENLHSNPQFDDTLRTMALFDIARGMQYLHSKNIVHRDLKSLNILFDNELHARICDFGYSKDITTDDLRTLNIGTTTWMAPEVINSTSDMPPRSYTSKVDVYSYGIIFWETVTGQIPYENMPPVEIALNVVSSHLRPPIPRTTPHAISRLMERCWDADPDKRPTFEEIVGLFKSGKLILNNADPNIFMDYIKETIGSDPVEVIEELIHKHQTKELIDTLLKEEFPSNAPSLAKKCWNEIEKLIPQPIITELIEKHGLLSQSGFSSAATFSSWPHATNCYAGMPSFFEFDENPSPVPVTVIYDHPNEQQIIDDIPTAEITVLSPDDILIESIDSNPNEITPPPENLDAFGFSETDRENIRLVCMTTPLFLTTQLKSRVASLLRILPPGFVPASVMASFAEIIPSGSDEFDDDIVIASCKNGAADAVVVYAITPAHLKLAFEVVAREGVDISLKEAVVDKCIQVLNIQCLHIPSKPHYSMPFDRKDLDSSELTNELIPPSKSLNKEVSTESINEDNSIENGHAISDLTEDFEPSKTGIKSKYRDIIGEEFMSDLTCSAIRCVVGIGEVKRLSPELIKKFLLCTIPEIKNCIYSTLAALALLDHHEIMPNEIADIMISNIHDEEDSTFAENALIAITQVSPNIGQTVLERFFDDQIEDISKYSILLQRMILVLWLEPDFRSFIDHLFSKYRDIDFMVNLKNICYHEKK